MIRMNRFSILLTLTLAAVAAVPSVALARGRDAAAAPVTTVSARFNRYLLAPNGHVMGLLMQDGSVVHTGHAMAAEAPALAPGDALQIEGRTVKTPTGTVYARAVVSKDGKVIADARHHRGHRRGDHKKAHHGDKVKLSHVNASGRVAAVISAPKGRVTTLVLEDGTTAMGAGLETLGLKAGDRIAVAGKGGTYAQGKALRIEKITLPDGTTRDLPKPQRRHREQQPSNPT